MFDKVLRTIERYGMLQSGNNVVLGLSGGADSMALLHCLLQLSRSSNIKVSAVHINHGLRSNESDSDEEFVRKVCGSWNVPITVFRFDLRYEAEKMKMSEEEAGRILRYECFEKVRIAEGAEVIATAHNCNDSAETVLFNLFRGCGLTGLSGIAPVRGRIIRPLIECMRRSIEDYCTGNNIAYCTDATNFQNIYTRNKIRLDVLPVVVDSINTRAIENITTASAIVAEEDSYLNLLAEEAVEECVTTGSRIGIDLIELNKHHPVMQKRIIRRAYDKAAGGMKDISVRHVESIVELAKGGTGKRLDLPGDIFVENEYNNIYFSKREEKVEDFCYNLIYNGLVHVKEIEKSVSLTSAPPQAGDYHGYLPIEEIVIADSGITDGLVVRRRRKGDIIYFKAMGGHKKIKKFLIDQKLPRHKREKLVYLAEGADIVCILGCRTILSDAYRAKDEEKKLYIQIWEGQL